MSRKALVPGHRLGPYLLEAKLALGGMAELWSAREQTAGLPERNIALKVMHPNCARDKDFRMMFVDEVRIALRLQHENIVRVYSSHEVDGHLFQSMELLDGVDLRKVVRSLVEMGEWFPTPLALVVGYNIARALNYAHMRRDESGLPMNIIHRDVSPHNVMLTRDGGVKLLDFGIAKAQERMTRTAAGVIKGKLSYMSPEQAMGHPLDQRSDIFSLGIVLWELMAMQRLFRGKSESDMLGVVVDAQIPDLKGKNPSVPTEAVELVHKMLSANRKHRPDTMQAVERGLMRIIARSYRPETSNQTALQKWLVRLLPGPKKRSQGTAVMPDEGTGQTNLTVQTEADRTQPDVYPPFSHGDETERD